MTSTSANEVPRGVGEPLFCVKKKGKMGFKKKGSTAVLYIHTSLCDFKASTDFLFLVEISFYKSMQQTINFISYLHTNLTSVILFLSHFAKLLQQNHYRISPKHFVLAAKVSELKAAAAAAAGIPKVRCSLSFRLALDSVWILPSAVAAARWAPDMLRTRLHSRYMRPVSLAQSLWFLPMGRVNCQLDVVHVHYS